MSTEAAQRPVLSVSSDPQPNPQPPRTEAASRVRLKHGFYSSRAVIPGEAEAEFQAFREDFILELMPSGPQESALVDQMVMAQWKLRRLWAAQTGVHLRHGQAQSCAGDDSPGGDAGYCERLAACVREDNAGAGDLHRLSLQEVRLINIFHKAQRKLELLREMRTKRLMRRRQADQIETEEYYLGREGYLKFGIRPPRLDSDGRVNPEWTDPHAPLPPEIAASLSSDGTSAEYADRRPPPAAPPLPPPGRDAAAPGAPRPPRLPRPDAATLAARQRHWEALQATEDAFGDRLEPRGAAGRV